MTDPDPLSRLCGPGGEFEIVEQDVRGQRMRVFAHREQSLREVLADSARFGERDCLVTETRRVSFSEHLTAVSSLARVLAGLGVGKGDRVMILAANSPEWIIAFWATVTLGAIGVAANAWWTEPELLAAVENSTPSLIIADAKRMRVLAEVDVPVLSVEHEITRMVRAYPDAELPQVEVDEDDPAVIVYTSGTSGRAKGATHSHRNLIATIGYHRLMSALAIAYGAPAVPHARFLLSMPLFHIASLHNVALPRLATGSTTVIYQGAFDPARTLRLVERERITNWTVVPTMASRLLEVDLTRYDLSALRAFGLATAPSSLALKDRLRDALPIAKAALVESYGQTESCTGATVATPEQLITFPGTVGGPIPCVDIEIRDEQNRPLPGGEVGEILLRSPYNMLGYWDDAQATAAAIDDAGWLHTGDIGTLRDGLLFLTGRRTDLIIRAGENVYPSEVEQCLDGHDAVVESAVIGVPHHDLGQQVAAIIVRAPGSTVTPDELTAFAAERLAYYKVPSLWRFADAPLPRNASGKVVRAGLGL